MENIKHDVKKRVHDIRFWWLISLLGVSCVMLGTAILLNPMSSYNVLSPVFGGLFVASAVTLILNICPNRKLAPVNRFLVYGIFIVELVLGAVLWLESFLSLGALIIAAGIWLFIKGMILLVLGNRLENSDTSASTVTLVSAAALFICSAATFVQLVLNGGESSVMHMALALIVGGITLFVFSVQARRLVGCSRRRGE
ncbi:MAG: DUF308 domain-containing protein [Rikenellaceae bacterium]|nr:DUF308 domain-containing protein [Rikenellaceae bacterium]